MKPTHKHACTHVHIPQVQRINRTCIRPGAFHSLGFRSPPHHSHLTTKKRSGHVEGCKIYTHKGRPRHGCPGQVRPNTWIQHMDAPDKQGRIQNMDVLDARRGTKSFSPHRDSTHPRHMG
eukprot:1147016-Pelagomonas_calceolata.AAC.3